MDKFRTPKNKVKGWDLNYFLTCTLHTFRHSLHLSPWLLSLLADRSCQNRNLHVTMSDPQSYHPSKTFQQSRHSHAATCQIFQTSSRKCLSPSTCGTRDLLVLPNQRKLGKIGTNTRSFCASREQQLLAPGAFHILEPSKTPGLVSRVSQAGRILRESQKPTVGRKDSEATKPSDGFGVSLDGLVLPWVSKPSYFSAVMDLSELAASFSMNSFFLESNTLTFEFTRS